MNNSSKQDKQAKLATKILLIVTLLVIGIWSLAITAHAAPIIANEEFTSAADTYAVITWTTTNEPTTTEVCYGVTTSPTTVFTADASAPTVNHYAYITGLNPGTIYYYYVKSGSSRSALKAFTTLTPPTGQYLFTFITVSDSQYAPGKADTYGARGRPYSSSEAILQEMVTGINNLGINQAFTILKGDIIESSGPGTYGDYVNTNTMPGGKTIKQEFGRLTSGTLCPIPGNHDKTESAYTGAATLRKWYDNNLFPLYNLTINPLTDSCYNYSFDKVVNNVGYRFIMLDSVMASLSSEVSTTFLETEITSAESLGYKSFVFLHHPMTDVSAEGIPPAIIEEITGGALDYNKIQVSNGAAARAIISAHKDSVAGVFAGHIHDNNYKEIDGVPYVRTCSGLQFPTGFNVYKVYTNGFMQTFAKIPTYSEYARTVVTAEAGCDGIYWQQFSLGPSSARNFVHVMSSAEPSVSYTTPTDTSSDVPTNEYIIIRFTKAMKPTETQNAVTISPALTSPTYSWPNTTTLVIGHSGMPASTAHTVTISTAAQATDGTTFARSTSFSFTTGTRSQTTAPVSAFDKFSDNISSDNQPVFTGISTDERSPIVSIECRVDRGSWYSASPLDTRFNSTVETFYFQAPSTLVRGFLSHIIEVKCTDASGNVNVEPFDYYSFYVIGDKPEIGTTINNVEIMSGDPVENTPSIEVLVVSNKGLSLYPLLAAIDNGAWTQLTKVTDPLYPGTIRANYKPTLADGTHSLKIMTSDDQGNVSTREVVGLVVDSKADTSIQGVPLTYPNPYNGIGNVYLSYILSKNSNTAITIHDLMGTQLKKISYASGVNGGKAGYNEITWDGKTDSGQDLGSGIYIYLVVADGRMIGKGKITISR